ncbi:MAG: cupin domain-containing protein [Thermomicrobiales bacterium]|jgi:quercetin dioxygenase-like cupin family protein
MNRAVNATRVLHREAPLGNSPSGSPIRYVATLESGARTLFVAEQLLEPGQAVPRHTHEVEEVLTFLSGQGEATCGDERHEVGEGVSLVIPPGVVHGFRASGDGPLKVLVIFAGNRFAATTAVENG